MKGKVEPSDQIASTHIYHQPRIWLIRLGNVTLKTSFRGLRIGKRAESPLGSEVVNPSRALPSGLLTSGRPAKAKPHIEAWVNQASVEGKVDRKTMKKIHVLGLALLAVFAFSAVAATSALAASKWLVDGVPLEGTETEPVETTGELELIHLAGGFFEPEAIILCSGIFLGFVGPGAADEITKLLTLGGVEVTEASPLSCTGVKTCETGSVVSAENLPWTTEIELMGGTVYLDLFLAVGTKIPAYLINCLVLGGSNVFLCFGETSAVLTNVAGGWVLGVFKPAELESEGLEGSCETPLKEKVALQSGEGETHLEAEALGTTLEVSE